MPHVTKKAAPWMAPRHELRYLRRDGNRRVRARRRRRTALRMALLGLLWAAVALGALVAYAAAGRWATSPRRFPLSQVEVRGNHEASADEIRDLARDWMGRNLFVIDLDAVERKVREHPWVGMAGAPGSGSVRIQRRLPGTLVITISERQAAGMALVGGSVFLLDGDGMPIDRHGPRYAAYDFPIIKGLDGLRADPARMKQALAAGVAVTRTLADREPGFYAQVSEIDVSSPDMVVLRLEGEDYDLRLSRDDCLRNLGNYFALRDQIRGDGTGAIDYVDLRWQNRIAVMPAVAAASDGAVGGNGQREQRNGGR